MIINGANLNNFSVSAMSAAGLHNRGSNTEKSLGNAFANNFARRFDSLELSNLFKKLSEGASSEDISASGMAAQMRKMLSKTESKEDADSISKGMAGYAYMEIAIAGEAARAHANQYLYSRYSEERDYYQCLLDDPDGIAHSATDEYGTLTGLYRDSYEYLCAEGTAFDREKAEQALANVQSKIDGLINEDRSGRVDFKTYNKCAKAAANAFGGDSSELVLSEDSFNRLFGKQDVTEENFIQYCREREQSLYKLCDKLHEYRDNFMNNLRREKNGSERANAVENAFKEAYGNSFGDIAKLIEEMKLDENEE